MAGVVAVGNLKGGTGKSTIAVHLTAQLVTDGKPAVLVDTDTQGTAGDWGDALQLEVRRLPVESQRGVETWTTFIIALSHDATVVIDCPPHIGVTMQAAFLMADLALLPVTASIVDIRATTGALNMLAEVRAERKGKPPALLVPSRVDIRTAAGRELPDALRKLGEPVGPSIGQRSAFADCAAAESWVGAFAPSSKAADEIKALTRAVMRRL